MQQPPAAKRGRKRKMVAIKTERFPNPSMSAEPEDSDTELYEAEYDLNDQKYIKKGPLLQYWRVNKDSSFLLQVFSTKLNFELLVANILQLL